MTAAAPQTIHIGASPAERQQLLLTPDAVRFLVKLSRSFETRRRTLLQGRRILQQAIDDGWQPDSLSETAEIRESSWRLAELPADLIDRRVEVSGPPVRETLIRGLNSGAAVFLADFEDSCSPTWPNLLEGQRNLQQFTAGNWSGEVVEEPAVLMVRPRAWHQVEKHFLVDGEPISASLFDFGLYFFHNARPLTRNGTGPYFYLPKVENHLEARLWNEVFVAAQAQLGMPPGTIRATVTVETVTAALEMDEILWELREHAAGLAWHPLGFGFSHLVNFSKRRQPPPTDEHAIAERLIATCHRRGVLAIGEISPDLGEATGSRVRDAKLREVWHGLDGTRVADPDLVLPAKRVFDTHMAFPNQLHCHPRSAGVSEAPKATTPGLENCLDVCLRYWSSWLGGDGCVPIDGRLADACTGETALARVRHSLRHRRTTHSQVQGLISKSTFALPGQLMVEMFNTKDLLDFFALRAYDYIE